jgi:hypothetical protein
MINHMIKVQIFNQVILIMKMVISILESALDNEGCRVTSFDGGYMV